MFSSIWWHATFGIFSKQSHWCENKAVKHDMYLYVMAVSKQPSGTTHGNLASSLPSLLLSTSRSRGCTNKRGWFCQCPFCGCYSAFNHLERTLEKHGLYSRKYSADKTSVCGFLFIKRKTLMEPRTCHLDPRTFKSCPLASLTASSLSATACRWKGKTFGPEQLGQKLAIRM